VFNHIVKCVVELVRYLPQYTAIPHLHVPRRLKLIMSLEILDRIFGRESELK